MNQQEHHLHQMKMQCKQHVNQPVHLQVHGQTGYNGIIEHVDDDHVYLLVPVDEQGQYLDLSEMMGRDERSPYPYQNPYYQPYYYPPNYGYPRPFGWNRLVLPLAALTALAVLF